MHCSRPARSPGPDNDDRPAAADKPTFGIIPKRGPTSAMVPTDISVRGPLTRSPEDLALLIDVLAVRH